MAISNIVKVPSRDHQNQVFICFDLDQEEQDNQVYLEFCEGANNYTWHVQADKVFVERWDACDHLRRAVLGCGGFGPSDILTGFHNLGRERKWEIIKSLEPVGHRIARVVRANDIDLSQTRTNQTYPRPMKLKELFELAEKRYRENKNNANIGST